MALYAIGDTHLSLSSDKPMDVFGGGWTGYVEKLREGLSVLEPGDTVVLCGDLSWGMSLEEARRDFAFLSSFPGRKLLLKGNHDYWWTTAAKMDRFSRKWVFFLSTAPQQQPSLWRHRPVRHPGLVLRGGTRRAQCQDLQPGADPAGGITEGGGGAGEILLPALSAPVSGVPVPGDPGSAPSVRRDPLLLRAPPRGEPPPGSGGRAGRHPVPAGLRGLSAVSTRKICD